MKRIVILLLTIVLFAGVHAEGQITITTDNEEVTTAQNQELSKAYKDSIMLQKLSPDQLMKLEQERNMLEKQRIEKEGKNEMPLNGAGIVMICMLPFLFVIVILIIQARVRNRDSQRRYDIYMKSIEMGQTVPEHFFDEPKKANASSNLKRGILWLVVGIAIVISFLVMKETDGLIVGIVPAFVGVGYLLVHMLDKPKTDSTVNNDEQHG